LAHTGHDAESLAEFRNAGCTETEAQTNLAFALTLEERWADARKHYNYALAQDSSSPQAQKGLNELNSLMVKIGEPGADTRHTSFSSNSSLEAGESGSLSESPKGARTLPRQISKIDER